MEQHLGERLPHARGRLRPPCRSWRSRSANGLAYLEAARARGLDLVTHRAAHVVLLQRAQPPVRGGRQVPRRAQAVGRAAARALRRPRRRGAQAALPHPDRGLDAHRAAAAQQRGARHRAGRWRRCWAARSRCTPTPTTRRSACPAQEAALLALRTQQVLAHESGVTDAVDPLAGSYLVESLTAELEARARELLERDRRPRAACCAAIAIGLGAAADPRGRVPLAARGRVRRARRGRREPVRRGRRRRRPPPFQPDPRRGARARARSSRAVARRARRAHACGARSRRLERAARGSDEPDAAHPRGAHRAAPRSARCATRCATCSACTGRERRTRERERRERAGGARRPSRGARRTSRSPRATPMRWRRRWSRRSARTRGDEELLDGGALRVVFVHARARSTLELLEPRVRRSHGGEVPRRRAVPGSTT